MIFAVPLYDDNPTARDPIVTYLLIGLCLGAFLWQLGQNERAILYGYGMIPAELFGLWRPPRAYQVVPAWTTLLTSMFLHGGWFHLIGNMLFLWIFGNNIEDVLGRGRRHFRATERMCRWSGRAAPSPGSSALICCFIPTPTFTFSSGL